MKILSTLCLLGLINCGTKPILDAGEYDVFVTYERDTWPEGLSYEGQTSETVWKIEHTKKGYVLKLEPFEYHGAEINATQILFWEQTIQECEADHFEVLLTPSEDGKSFSGSGLLVNDFCYDLFYIQSTFEGALR